MLNWVNQFSICCFLDTQQYPSIVESVECLAAAGAVQTFFPLKNSLAQINEFYNQTNDWLFGHINYDLKNEIEPLHSSHPDNIKFPTLFFFQPETVMQLSHKQLTISTLTKNPESIYQELLKSSLTINHRSSTIETKPRISKAEYMSTINKLLTHIKRGDCYEINYCQEFYAEEITINPLPVYHRLMEVSPNPFSCYYKLKDKYLICASPERFIQKRGNRILSQPIKGTAKRDLTNQSNDQVIKKQLLESEKDKSENVMVVDLVRNDLSRVCKVGSVEVDELFGVYSFPQVHQMISTIKGELIDGISFAEIIKACFPMGSMTGAPKRRVMELIELYEKTKRGIYSGAVGYINPEKDFDFNVVIRSILYNATNQYLCYLVGGGITFYSDPENEYAECLLKASAINNVLKEN